MSGHSAGIKTDHESSINNNTSPSKPSYSSLDEKSRSPTKMVNTSCEHDAEESEHIKQRKETQKEERMKMQYVISSEVN